jgi:hypothetical protein
MFAASNPEMLVANVALGGLATALLWRLILWVRDSPVKPDPWDVETENKLSAPDAVQVCHHCFTEQPENSWFCPKCGSAVGPYNNLMPYVSIFSEGEVYRNGASGKLRPSALIVTGYFLLSFGFGFFAPVYWLLLFKSFRHQKKLLSSGGTGPHLDPPN